MQLPWRAALVTIVAYGAGYLMGFLTPTVVLHSVRQDITALQERVTAVDTMAHSTMAIQQERGPWFGDIRRRLERLETRDCP